jgi:PST family polysaccharide transporter
MHRWSGLRRPALGDPRHAWPLVRIGSPIAATAALELALFAVTAVVVSRQLGPDALAFYVLAFNVSSWPAMVVTQAIRKVAVGAFAVMAGDEARTGRATRLGVSLLLLLAVPLAAVLAAAADPLLRTLYGGDAGVAATALAWLVVLGAARVLTGFLFDVLVSIGLERRVLVTQLLWVVVAVPAVWWGTAEAGITGAAAAHALVAIGVVLPSAVAHIQRVAAAGWAWWSTLAAVVAAGGLALVAAQPVVRLAGGSPVAIVAGGVTAVGVYLVALRLLGAHRLVRELRAGARQQLS